MKSNNFLNRIQVGVSIVQKFNNKMGGGFTETCNDFSMYVKLCACVGTQPCGVHVCVFVYRDANLSMNLPDSLALVHNQLKYTKQLNFYTAPDVI